MISFVLICSGTAGSMEATDPSEDIELLLDDMEDLGDMVVAEEIDPENDELLIHLNHKKIKSFQSLFFYHDNFCIEQLNWIYD